MAVPPTMAEQFIKKMESLATKSRARPPELKVRSIIAMKGAPFTRKTEIATLVAKTLSCPVLSIDHFLDFLHPDIAFQIICRIAASHLSTSAFDEVVIDSPLYCRPHLQQLFRLASSLPETRLLIIECKPKNTYLWRMKFEEFLHSNPDYTRKWYKAKSWDDVDKAIRHNYDERSDGYKISKLILDPLSDCQFDKYTAREFLSHPLMNAIIQMITGPVPNPDIVLYHQWQTFKPLKAEMKNRQLCILEHRITEFLEGGLEYEANCGVCKRPVMGEAYTCNYCIFTLHKDCAESFYNKLWRSLSPEDVHNSEIEYTFPNVSPCESCKESRKGFSYSCRGCLFETHIGCRLMPTVIRHECEEHFLSIVLSPAKSTEGVYKCTACGGLHECFRYSCEICGVSYSYKCLTEIPRRVKHVHGGHHHRMLLKFSSKPAEDYLCHECMEIRDPQLWFYSCEDCLFEVHLPCILDGLESEKGGLRMILGILSTENV